MQAPHQHANSTPPLSKSLATGLISYAFLKNNAQIYLHIMPKICQFYLLCLFSILKLVSCIVLQQEHSVSKEKQLKKTCCVYIQGVISL